MKFSGNQNEAAALLAGAMEENGLVPTLHAVFGKHIALRLGFSRAALNSDINVLELSVRSANGLRRQNINDLEGVIDRIHGSGLRSIRNLGAKSCAEIETKLVQYGYDHLTAPERLWFCRDLLDENARYR